MNEPGRDLPSLRRLATLAAPWLLLGLAAALRLPRLDLRPLHHDEGTNVIFLLRLLKEGTYQYDPSNYHGPLLYFLSVIPLRLLGTTGMALRLVPALLGTLLAGLPWLLRRELGIRGAIVSGILLAVSPSLVYYSRDNIHEIYLAFLTLGLVTAVVRGAVSAHTRSFFVAGMAAGGLLATKETACLTLLALATGYVVSRAADLSRIRPKDVLAFLAAALLVTVALYSDLFVDLGGLARPLQAMRLWGSRGLHADGHGKPWWYFLGILGRDEPVILVAGVAGAGLALLQRDGFGKFLAGWGGTMLLIYSAIPYKTPWLVLNCVLPLALLGGRLVELMSVQGPSEVGARVLRRPWLTVLLLTAGIALSARRAFDLSFVRYDDDRASALIYVQTRREVLRLVARLEEFANGRSEGHDVSVEILSPDYLPLNWYLRDFTSVGYFGSVIESPNAPAVIARMDDCGRVTDLLGGGYSREDYPLRPGVDLCLFLRDDPVVEEAHPKPL